MNIVDKFNMIKKELKNFDLTNVLDAGSSLNSAEFLAQLHPEKLTCICFKGDYRKGKEASKYIRNLKKTNYKFVYNDFSNPNLFNENEFSFILADYLLGEINSSKINKILENFQKFLQKKGKIIIVDRKAYWGCNPPFKYDSMGKLEGDPNLKSRSNRDLIALVDIYLLITKVFTIMPQAFKSYDYPSDWIIKMLKNYGFKNIKIKQFETDVNIKQEFLQRSKWTLQRIDNLDNYYLKRGLMTEFQKIIDEFRLRKVPLNETFPRQHYMISAEK